MSCLASQAPTWRVLAWLTHPVSRHGRPYMGNPHARFVISIHAHASCDHNSSKKCALARLWSSHQAQAATDSDLLLHIQPSSYRTLQRTSTNRGEPILCRHRLLGSLSSCKHRGDVRMSEAKLVRRRSSSGLTLAEAVLEPPGQVLHVAHPAGASGLPADGLLAPLDCERRTNPEVREHETRLAFRKSLLTGALLGRRVPASAAGALLNVVALAAASPADRVRLVAALTYRGKEECQGERTSWGGSMGAYQSFPFLCPSCPSWKVEERKKGELWVTGILSAEILCELT